MPTQINFSSGELSSDFYASADMAQFQSGCAMAQNFIPGVYRVLKRRSGFLANGAAKFGDRKCRLIAYVRSDVDANVVELGDAYTRIWNIDGTPVLAAGVPYEVGGSPYAAADLDGLRWGMLGNCLVFFHADGREPWRLQKASDGTWNWALYAFNDGPWQAENIDQTITITATDYHAGANVTIAASKPIFNPGMVGNTQMRIRADRGLTGLPTWKADWDPIDNQLVVSNGRIYYTPDGASAAKTGNTPPQHDFGIVSDGGVRWTYLHDNSGTLVITGYTDAQTVTATVIRNLPTRGTSEVSGGQTIQVMADPAAVIPLDATFSWAFSAYSDYYGWPTAWPTLRAERLIVGGGRTSPDKYDGSQVAGYKAAGATFTPGLGTGLVLDDDGVQGFCSSESYQANWFSSGSMLICGTHGSENAIVGSSGEAEITPMAASPKAVSHNGSAPLRPVKAQDTLLYVVKGYASLRNLTVSPYDFPGTSEDLMPFAAHIGSRQLAEIDYCSGPAYQAWARLGDGGLAVFAYNREQNVKGWARQLLGGGFTVESLCVVPDTQGVDRLWISGYRAKGTGQRLVMMLSHPAALVRLEASRVYQGAATNTVNGADWLEGETILAMVGQGDGKYLQYEATVTGGSFTLPKAGTVIIYGLPYTSRYESLPLISYVGPGKYVRASRANLQAIGWEFTAGNVNSGERGDTDYSRDFDETNGIGIVDAVTKFTLPGDSELNPQVYVECANGFDLVIKSINVELA
jgi:hypothetical protein